jgi:hypothetical protein
MHRAIAVKLLATLVGNLLGLASGSAGLQTNRNPSIQVFDLLAYTPACPGTSDYPSVRETQVRRTDWLGDHGVDVISGGRADIQAPHESIKFAALPYCVKEKRIAYTAHNGKDLCIPEDSPGGEIQELGSNWMLVVDRLAIEHLTKSRRLDLCGASTDRDSSTVGVRSYSRTQESPGIGRAWDWFRTAVKPPVGSTWRRSST